MSGSLLQNRGYYKQNLWLPMFKYKKPGSFQFLDELQIARKQEERLWQLKICYTVLFQKRCSQIQQMKKITALIPESAANVKSRFSEMEYIWQKNELLFMIVASKL